MYLSLLIWSIACFFSQSEMIEHLLRRLTNLQKKKKEKKVKKEKRKKEKKLTQFCIISHSLADR